MHQRAITVESKAGLHADGLREVILFVRPEERHAVERTLQSLVGAAYLSLPALGRGSGGPPSRRRLLAAGRPRTAAQTACLRKAAFFLILPAADVDELLDAVGATLRSERGPDGSGLGLGVVLPVDEVHVVEAVERSEP